MRVTKKPRRPLYPLPSWTETHPTTYHFTIDGVDFYTQDDFNMRDNTTMKPFFGVSAKGVCCGVFPSGGNSNIPAKSWEYLKAYCNLLT